MLFCTEYADQSYGGSAPTKFSIEVTGGDDFPVRIAFKSDLWVNDEWREPVPMKRGYVALGAVEAQALAVAILLVTADRASADWAKQTLNFDLTGPNFHFVLAQLPSRYLGAIAEARLAVQNVMNSRPEDAQ